MDPDSSIDMINEESVDNLLVVNLGPRVSITHLFD